MNVEEVVTINESPAALFAFWRSLELLPRFMDHLVSVTQLSPRLSRWIAKAPMGRTIEWEAEIINEVVELIAWSASSGARSIRCS